MKSSKGNTMEEEEEYEDDYSSKKEGTSKDARINDKAHVMRSKHSVTEQRRRSKINERFQILRDLIPLGDQKKDTASFLLEVIEYVQLLQEKVHNYEGSYQGLSTEPTKLMPWAIKNGPLPAATLVGKIDEKSVSINPSVTLNAQTPVDADSSHDAFRTLNLQSELGDKAATVPIPFQVHMPAAVQNDGDGSFHIQRPASDALASPCTVGSDDQQEEHRIEGGTISISSAYSHGLLMTLTQALQSSGVDLSQANISIRIDLGKRANQSLVSGISDSKENLVSHDSKIGHSHVRDGGCGDELDHLQKKLKS